MNLKSFSCCTIVILLVSFYTAQGQNRYTLDGYIRDSASGETIIGATISIGGKSVASNQYGFYSITIREGDYNALVSHVSYLTQTFHVHLRNHIEHNIYLVPRSQSLSEVVLYSKRRDANIKNAQMGRVDLSINQVKNIPAFLGEIDILKTIQLLPGVRNAGEGNAGFYVRGGGPDQNLILLDDAVVYNTGHLFGFFSIFN
ncbi:MAG TPA: carboxypeptidase-like regulatory domain-containing protein, partial [Flavisolibacter sp.]|nr:carboxypeptidase-like regulatory domain-containing protein [Flavisolibacter sp.]